jgi:2-polyprenyl-3-methyl-5-hydroxy-6-metoxy-1,4-benzoquinol methylase
MAGRPDFSQRSYEKELLDRDDIPFADIERNMQELDIINTWLGGHAISIRGLKDLVEGIGPPERRISICEIGCGGGDNLRVLSRWCRKRGFEVEVTGIDNNEHCIKVARERWKEGNASWIHSDYRDVIFPGKKPDILFSSLFCHHFTDGQLVEMLQWMQEHTGSGWFINDLQRHPLAWFSIRLLTKWFSRSYLVKNDAPLSVLRGFSRSEWENLLQAAGITGYSLQWKWAFRWLVEVRNN